MAQAPVQRREQYVIYFRSFYQACLILKKNYTFIVRQRLYCTNILFKFMRERELIIVGENLVPDKQQRAHNFRCISKLLLHAESMDAFCTANEIIDVNKYRHFRKKHLVQKIMSDNRKPFVFVVNKN